jgi:hypothetical protein
METMMPNTKAALAKGDTVRYSTEFLDRIRAPRSIRLRRGTVVRLGTLAVPTCYVQWDDGNLSPALNANLTKVR